MLVVLKQARTVRRCVKSLSKASIIGNCNNPGWRERKDVRPTLFGSKLTWKGVGHIGKSEP